MEIRDMDDVHFMRSYLDVMEKRILEENQITDDPDDPFDPDGSKPD